MFSDKVFSITPKDLNMVKYINDMMNISVNSFKIEGRMRSIYYVCTVLNVYRNIIDKIMNNTITDAYIKYYQDILNRCANRESTAQFYDKLPTNKEQYFLGRQEESNQDFIGLVKNYDVQNKLLIIEQRNYFKKGDVLEIFGSNMEPYELNINKIYNENMEEIDIARHPKEILKIPCQRQISPNSMLRIKIFDISNYL